MTDARKEINKKTAGVDVIRAEPDCEKEGCPESAPTKCDIVEVLRAQCGDDRRVPLIIINNSQNNNITIVISGGSASHLTSAISPIPHTPALTDQLAS